MRLLALMKKEFLQFWRDPVLLLIVFWAFSVDIYFAGKGLTLDVRNFPVAVYDGDDKPTSWSFIDQLRPPRFNVTTITDRKLIDHLLDTDQILIALEIDKNFTRNIAQGRPAQIQALLDGTNSNSASMALAYLSNIAAAFKPPLKVVAQKLVQQTDQDTQAVASRTRVLFNENLESTWFMSLSELFAVITMVAILLPAAAMVREKEYGTIEQLLVAPLRAWQVMLAKIIPMALLVVCFTAISVYVVLGWCFGFHPRGSLLLFLAVTTIYVFTTAGLGMLIATAARNLSQIILMMLAAMIPIMFLSGTWCPPEAMPPHIRWFAWISPLSYYLDIGYGIFFKGVGVTAILKPLFLLIVLGGAMFTFGTTRLGRKLAA